MINLHYISAVFPVICLTPSACIVSQWRHIIHVAKHLSSNSEFLAISFFNKLTVVKKYIRYQMIATTTRHTAVTKFSAIQDENITVKAAYKSRKCNTGLSLRLTVLVEPCGYSQF